MTVVLYARVSCVEQTAAHQERQARNAGFAIDEVVVDEGVSGVSTTLRDRPQGKRLFDLLRRGDVLVVRWVDRLGRNYQDVTHTIREFMDKGIVVRTVINNMTFDGATTEPIQKAVRDALIAFMAASAEAQAEATKQAQRAGIDHAKDKKPASYLGRKPTYTRGTLDQARTLLAENASISAIAKQTGLSRQTIYRLQKDPAGAEAALNAWDL